MKTEKTPLCPDCGVRYRKVLTNFESGGVIVKNVAAFACPKCGCEIFSQEQAAEIRRRLQALSPSLQLARKISSAAGKKPVLYLPAELLSSVGLKIGDIVKIGLEGKHRLVITPA